MRTVPKHYIGGELVESHGHEVTESLSAPLIMYGLFHGKFTVDPRAVPGCSAVANALHAYVQRHGASAMDRRRDGLQRRGAARSRACRSPRA